MDEKEVMDRIKRGKFVRNNGRVLRVINMLRYRYEKLSEVKYALDIPENEYLDSLNYLSEEEYIQLRHIKSKQIAALADTNPDELEAKLTGKGIRLLAGKLFDELVEV